MNELLLTGSLILTYGTVLLAYRFFGKNGLFCMSVVATVLANIEVSVLVVAFGIEQTLGNILFASTFLTTDILNECEGKKDANKAVAISTCTSVFFLIISRSWLWYEPSENDIVHGGMVQVFANTPRVIIASLSVYAISQFFDVWLYNRWWSFTEKHFGSRRKFLWLRNNASTMISQLVNTLLFTALAFWGTYDTSTFISICVSTYAIYFILSLLDTPFIYLARRINDRKTLKQNQQYNTI